MPAIVSIKVTATRAFDTESAGSSVATGFIVDAKQGLILTNRHVVQPGPVVAKAVFLDHEEVDIQAVYRDPVHDFGIYRFNPADVHFMDVEQLELAPESARVGVDIRIVGNDAGEKISILTGTLARLDRDAPNYGRFRFNDFNTFYYQAASGTSGGSSGSPVINQQGQVIALNAGSRRQSASSYFLPLDRVVRALDLIRRGQPVTRGTWQSTLQHQAFDELRRLGLSPQTEARVRKERPNGTGMLVVTGVVPGGPAIGLLELGDILVDVDGQLITTFSPLEHILDQRVDDELSVVVDRGGEAVELTVPVQDLFEITPDSYLDVGDAVLNELSYQQARHALVAVGGAYVAASGYMLAGAGIGADAVITAIGDQAVYDLDEAQQAFEALPDGAKVPVRWFDLSDPQTQRVGVIVMDRRWFPMERCTWHASDGTWPCQVATPPPPAPAPQVVETTFPAEDSRIETALSHSLVLVDFEIPFRVQGVYDTRFIGTGLVVDAKQGLVVVDRDTVPVALGDVRLVFAGSVEIPGTVETLHPLHNVAVIRYDPALLGQTPVRSAVLRDQPLSPGDRVWHVGLDRHSRVVSEKTRIESVDPLHLPLPQTPFFRDSNVEVASVQKTASSSGGGVLADRRGRVVALWASFVDLSGDKPRAFFRGLPTAILNQVVVPLREDKAPRFRALGVELAETSLVDARNRGLPDGAALALEQASGVTRRAFLVARVWEDAPAHGLLREGDILLQVDGRPAVDLLEIEQSAQSDQVTVQVARDGTVQDIVVPTIERFGADLDRVLSWSGTLLHAVQDAVPEQRGLSPEGVYVAWYWYGSPAARYGLRPTRRIQEVNGQPTPDLDAFLAAVQGVPDGGAVRLKTEDLDGREEVTTLEVDLTYWPTWELVRGPDGWQRHELSSTASPASPAPR
ncbi:MAG: PDZ domain-containing protein [Oligoflexia bacterium]|nr:PDZ domain-containing protein [Oligoflexia bacterium]